VYAPATFVRSDDSTLTLSVPNAVHRGKCEEQRTAVEAAVGTFVGSPVTIELLDGDGGGGGAGGRAGDDGEVRRARDVDPASAAPTSETGSSPDGEPRDDAETTRRDDPAGDGDRAAGTSPRERGMAAAAAATDPAVTPDDGPEAVAPALPDDDEVDLDDLVDAPPESIKTPIDRLAEAFPGSELIEEAG
jgi:DNA polymerase-3 subunit gamma/tau